MVFLELVCSQVWLHLNSQTEVIGMVACLADRKQETVQVTSTPQAACVEESEIPT